MDIIVVGSGVAGLTAAIGLRRAGHRVRVFERAPIATAFGAGVVIGYNAAKVLTSFGMDYEAARMNVAGPTTMVQGDSLKTIQAFNDGEYRKISGSKQYYAHRVDLQEGLLRLASVANKNAGSGPPVEMVYNAHVVSYDPKAGSITLEDGSTHSADLIVAADGVHSLAPRFVLGHDWAAAHTGTTIIRFMLPSSSILSDPQTAGLLDKKGHFVFYVHPERKRWLLQYPVRDNTEQNYGMYSIKDNERDVDAQEFRFKCDRESLKRELEGFNDSIVALADKTTEILPLWKLPERSPLPTWYRGRLVVIGDAAHPMLPNQGQGAGMAIEDSGALSVIFSKMGNTSNECISSRLALFQQVRKGRASVVQLISSVPYFEDAVKIMYSKLVEQLPPDKLPASENGVKDIRLWLFNYNVIDDSRQVLDEFLSGPSPSSNL